MNRTELKKWEPHEEKYLRLNYHTTLCRDIATHLGRTEAAVKRKVDHMGLVRNPRWSEDHKAYVKAHYATMSMELMVQHLGRAAGSIHTMAQRLKCTGKRYGVNNALAGRSYNSPGLTTRNHKKKADKPHRKITSAVRSNGRKANPDKAKRWDQKKFKIKDFDPSGKKLIRIDHKTCVYVPSKATDKEIETIVNRYKK